MRNVLVALGVALVVAGGCVAAAVPGNAPPVAPWLPVDRDGWSVLAPSPDTHVHYVSAGEGDDATAAAYVPGDPAVGADPFRPAGAVKPFRTIAAALAKARDGFPDWVLLKRGDAWEEGLRQLNGRSAKEPFVIAAYGPGPERPLLRVGAQVALRLGSRGFHDVAVVGLAFYAHTRDPRSPDFVSNESRGGIECALMQPEATGERLLIEDCSLRMVSLVLQARQGTLRGVVVRRNQILDCYSAGGHSQGFFAYHGSFLVEENVFDHNGWSEDPRAPHGKATMFNHNTYFSGCSDVVFRGNMFLRGSSGGNKWRSDVTGAARNITIDDNLYVENEVAISIGGNTNEPLRFANVSITDNVLLDVGRGRPTGRTLGWYLDVQDWDGGTIAGNLLLHQASDAIRNVYGIHVGGRCRNVAIRDNIIHGLKNGTGLILSGGGKEGIALRGNVVHLPAESSALARVDGGLDGYSFAGNTWFAGLDPARWFSVEKRESSLAAWVKRSGETAASERQPAFPDPERTVESYNASLGGAPTLADFISAARRQSRANWRPELTAHAVNEYLRAGFGRTGAGP